MIQQQPRSNLFPYTTLFRSLHRRAVGGGDRAAEVALARRGLAGQRLVARRLGRQPHRLGAGAGGDRKSTRLNSSHSQISYAVLCLNKKNTKKNKIRKQHDTP